MVISIKLDPWQRYTPPLPYKKKCFKGLRSPLSVVVGGGMLMPTAFAPIYIVSVKKKYGGGV